MGRGVSSGGGQSSLGYLFGDDRQSGGKAAPPAPAAVPQAQPAQQQSGAAASKEAAQAQAAHDKVPKELPAAGKSDSGTSLNMGNPRLGRNNNNYHRSDGQNTGNFITVS